MGADVLHRLCGDRDAAGRLACRPPRRQILFLASLIGFTLASALCGGATSLTQFVLFRVLQRVCSAGLVPLGQATLYTVYPRERHGYAMAIFATGSMMGPIVGPTLGGWLTDNFGWRWCFYINLPVGALCALGVFVFIQRARGATRAPFDMFGFATLSIAVGTLPIDARPRRDQGLVSLYRNLDRGDDLGARLLSVDRPHGDDRGTLVLSRELLKTPNFIAGSLMMFAVGVILSGTLALMPSMMQDLMNYPVFDAGG